MTETTTVHAICPLWRRLLALIYDLVAVLAIVMVVGLLCELATDGELISTGAHVHIPWWYQSLQALVVAAYFVVSWLRGGQTLGMRPWRIRVTANGGAPLSVRQSLVRIVVAALPLLLLLLAPLIGLKPMFWAMAGVWGLWFATALLGVRRQAMHDLAAGTEVRWIR